ncbi:MAG: helix-turn-helix domain-containing protein [Planctomycetota bacterium]
MPKKASEPSESPPVIGQDDAVAGSAKWTFLTNHAHVLAMVHMHPELVLREIALHVGITERAVQRIVQELEEAGFITRERVGRRNTYQVETQLPLRHPIESHRNIGDLLDLVSQNETVEEQS